LGGSAGVWVLAALPILTSFVGWITNWCAVRMIFWPQHFVGVGRFGWQGIVYRHNRKFAKATADLATESLLTPKDITDRLDPDELADRFEGAFDAESRTILRECWEVVRPGLWDSIPEVLQDVIVGQVRRDGKRALREVYQRFRSSSDDLIDLHALAMDALTRDDGRNMARLVQEFGAKELHFIIIYGAVFGALIGLVEAAFWVFFQVSWLLPVLGGLVGAGTNWLAIQMIFRPYEPTRYLGLVTYQGLFPARQEEIARDYASVTAREVVTAHNLIGMLTHGEGAQRLAEIVSDSVKEHFDAAVARFRGPLPLILLGPLLEKIRETIVEQVLVALPHLQPEFEAYLDQKLDVEAIIHERMSGLSKPEFEGILRGVFEEDEWILIAIGGVLGAAIGVGQAAIMAWA
jgi:uncharacterized membrane protein YheB (UPF0754 family)